MTCPSCERAELDARRICPACGVGVPAVETAGRVMWSTRPRILRQDQGERYGYADYAATKEDKQ